MEFLIAFSGIIIGSFFGSMIGAIIGQLINHKLDKRSDILQIDSISESCWDKAKKEWIGKQR